MATILIVEDDANARLLTEANLKRFYNTLTAANGKEALSIIYDKHVDLILSDIMMPVMDGYEMAKALRDEGSEVPIIFMTAKQSTEDKIEGFSSGVDDYMVKPIDYSELLWRIKAVLRRYQISDARKLRIGGLVIDSESYRAEYNGENIELTRKEFDLLFKLLSYPNRIFTKNQLLDDVWGIATPSGDDTIKVHVSKLRNKTQKIAEFEIVSVKGIGYKAVVRGDA